MSGGRAQIEQVSLNPLVYLDHAPLMEVAQAQARRFASALIGAGGTLGLSFVNLIEISNVSAPTGAMIQELIDRVWPHIIFLEAEFGAVIAQENQLLGGVRIPLPPQINRDMGAAYGRLSGTESLDPQNPKGFVEVIRSESFRLALGPEVEKAAAQGRSYLEQARQKIAENEALAKRIKAQPKGLRIQYPTRYVAQEILRGLLRSKSRMDPHNYNDLWHTVVPVSYCDLVVLDKQWAENARQVQERLRARGLLTHEAKVFSVGQLEEALKELDVRNRDHL
jgi:hypothetical protein